MMEDTSWESEGRSPLKAQIDRFKAKLNRLALGMKKVSFFWTEEREDGIFEYLYTSHAD